MTPSTRIAAVTGANKGIGLAIVRQLALQYPKSPFSSNGSVPFLIYLTARDQGRGEAALSEIHNDPHLKKAKALQEDGGLSTVKFLKLDIDDESSIESFASHIKSNHPEGIDILVNNAGIALTGFDAAVVKKTLHSNYFGTMLATQLLLPHIRDGGRIVNVASAAGHLSSKYSPIIRNRFLNAKKPEEITQLMEEFSTAVEKGIHQNDWPSSAYAVSKAGVIGMTKTVAEQAGAKGSKVLINSCCPGYVKTDMTKGGGMKTADQGAETPVVLALHDIHGATGQFWQNEKPTSW